MHRPQIILIGGFLGAGKTTLIAHLLRLLTQRRLRAAVITNDQAPNLVDTALLQHQTPDIAEVAGACFCCSFNSFVDQLQALHARLRPDILIGEPVGSCTDLAATVVRPLQKFHTDTFLTRPYAVLVDPDRFRQSIAPRSLRKLPDTVIYIYRLQIEEADVILLNKTDQLTPCDQADLIAELARRYPNRPIFPVSALTGQGLSPLLDHLLSSPQAGQHSPEIDYSLYAQGEASLGWLNASIDLSSPTPLDYAPLCRQLLHELRTRLASHSAEIVHAKLFLTTPLARLAANLTSTDTPISLRPDSLPPSSSATLLLNLRAHTTPQTLQQILLTSLRAAAPPPLTFHIPTINSLSPSPPHPTHRLP